jgi:hypothetical protein
MGAHAFVIADQTFSRHCCSHRVHHRIGPHVPRALVFFTPGGGGQNLHDMGSVPCNTTEVLALRYGSSLRDSRTAHDRPLRRRQPIENAPGSSKMGFTEGRQ